MTWLLRVGGLLGTVLFGALLILLVSSPKAFERSALSFVKNEVTREVLATYPSLADRSLDDSVQAGLGRLADRLGIQKDALDALAASNFPDLAGKMMEDFCACTPVSAEESADRTAAIRSGLELRATALGFHQARVVQFMKGQYTETIDALRRDLKVFLSVNLIAFASVFGATFVARSRRHTVAVPGALLVMAVVICSAAYLIGTDWFYAILFQDYIGLWYGAGLLVVYASIADILLNKAKLTLNLLSSLPSALTVPPC